MNEKDIKRLVSEYIVKNYGKRCGAFIFCCPVCEAWMAFDLIFEEPDTEYKITKVKHKGKNHD